MTEHGGKRPGAGRKPGSTTRFQKEQVAKAIEGGIMPLDYMLEVLRDEGATSSDRLDAAKSAAPYVHSKMPTAIVTPPPPSGPVGAEDEALIDRYLNGLHDEADES